MGYSTAGWWSPLFPTAESSPSDKEVRKWSLNSSAVCCYRFLSSHPPDEECSSPWKIRQDPKRNKVLRSANANRSIDDVLVFHYYIYYIIYMYIYIYMSAYICIYILLLSTTFAKQFASAHGVFTDRWWESKAKLSFAVSASPHLTLKTLAQTTNEENKTK